jgi:Na+/H+ antiporter NhaD/arsenite permease-like protein
MDTRRWRKDAFEGATPPAKLATDLVELSGRSFLIGCGAVSALLVVLGRFVALPAALIPIELFAAIVGLFVFGTVRYRLDKNALSYGLGLVIVATFSGLPTSKIARELAERGVSSWARAHLLTLDGLDELVHADTMLFLLGLTCLVATIAQTRLLERLTLSLLGAFRGSVLPTVGAVLFFVALSSGILDGVSMIALTIRTLLIILATAAAPAQTIRYSIMICTLVTTVCGVYLSYGEPPNLIMRANLYPHLNNLYFLEYCGLPAAVSLIAVVVSLRARLRGLRVDLDRLDILDAHTDVVRFVQAQAHGDIVTPHELVEDLEPWLREATSRLLLAGKPFGAALVLADVPEARRLALLGRFVRSDLAAPIDQFYVHAARGETQEADKARDQLLSLFEPMIRRQTVAQRVALAGLASFVALLVLRAVHVRYPLFFASFAAFGVAFFGIAGVPSLRSLAWRDARREFGEYLFLLPLFLSIALMKDAGLFDDAQVLLGRGIASAGETPVALAQFAGCTGLSAILDNNIVADIASRALPPVAAGVLRLFATAQILGYALGGCLTFLGSAQSIIAYAFITRTIDRRYTPGDWTRDMAPLGLTIFVLLGAIVAVEGLLLG